MIPLTETEQQIIVLALFGYVMRAGPGQFGRTNEIAHKLGVQVKYEAYAKSWIAAPKDGQPPKDPLITTAETTVKLAILNGILTQWHMEHGEAFPKALMEGVYKELFEGIHYKSAIRALLKSNAEAQEGL